MSGAIVPFVVGIAGGSGSGKTELTRGLVAALGPDRVAVLGHDAYYRDRAELDAAARAALDYDVTEALDRERFLDDLTRLRAGETLCPPRYCFVTHRRLGAGEPLEPRDILIVEGILLFHDAEVRRALDLAIFVDAPGDLRLRRRIARDTIERGRTAASVTHQFASSVAPAHLHYVEPTKSAADLVLTNTSRIEPLVELAATLIRSRLDRCRTAVPVGES